MPSIGLSELRQNTCRKAAQDLLASLRVLRPSEIDLEMLGYAAGRLIIEEEGLETSEGRLVATRDKGGSIRVKAGLSAGRKRFTIAHEIGHFVLHPLEEQDRQHTRRDFSIFHNAGEEAEANI